MRLVWLIIAALLCAAPIATLAATNDDGVAVIIGNRDYKDIPDVDFAVNDADAFKRFVVDVLGYDTDNIIDLRNATKAQLEAAFGNDRTPEGRLWRYLDPEGRSDVVVFYSGHGVPGLKDQRGYLLPVDADPDAPEINGYPVDQLYRNLAKLKARSITVLLDACFSGETQKGMVIRATSGISVTPKLPASSKLTILTAAQGDQVASWDEPARHGLFTNHVLDALYGAADKGRYGNGDGKVALGEVKSYLDRNMSRAARRAFGRIQKATMVGDRGTILVTYPGGKAPQRPKNSNVELAFWNSIKDSKTADEFRAYLEQYPRGGFVPLARQRIAALTKPALKPVVNSLQGLSVKRFDGTWKGESDAFECSDPEQEFYFDLQFEVRGSRIQGRIDSYAGSDYGFTPLQGTVTASGEIAIKLVAGEMAGELSARSSRGKGEWKAFGVQDCSGSFFVQRFSCRAGVTADISGDPHRGPCPGSR